MPDIFDTVRVGRLTLANRIAYGPMTRNRAGADGVPPPLAATYYAQRADAGVVISEGTQPSATGQGYARTPGLHTDAQQAGWARVADAVHGQGGRMVVQLMHGGRIGHPDMQPGGRAPVAPSAVRPRLDIVTPTGPQASVTPRELRTDELPGVVADFAAAARRAVAAGMDGVELHAANGYLLHQFLAESTNHRTDAYGGPAVNRARFVVQTAAAVGDAIGADRVGVKISPQGRASDIEESDSLGTYAALVDGLASLGLAYLHVVEPPTLDADVRRAVRERWPSTVLLSTGFEGSSELDSLRGAVARGDADVVVVGRPFLANPDLPRRWREGAPLNEPDSATFYGGDARGYTDYPFLDDASVG